MGAKQRGSQGCGGLPGLISWGGRESSGEKLTGMTSRPIPSPGKRPIRKDLLAIAVRRILNRCCNQGIDTSWRLKLKKLYSERK